MNEKRKLIASVHDKLSDADEDRVYDVSVLADHFLSGRVKSMRVNQTGDGEQTITIVVQNGTSSP